MLVPTLLKQNDKNRKVYKVVSETTSNHLNRILRKVVTADEGTASLADIHGYYVAKTGTSQNYKNERKFEYLYFNFSVTRVNMLC